ncbi:MAG: hypothetical protein F2667_09320, partial [Actinobacteria bacterium]|nr:hypothetical protein [Actinomycetota bacterium]
MPSRMPRLRPRLGVSAVFVTVLALLVAGFAPAYAAGESTISGTVTRQGSLSATPLSGVTVSLLTADGAALTPAVTTTTAADGTYTLTADTPGTYNVSFARTGYDTEYFTESATAAGAQDLVIAASSTRPGTNATLSNSTTSEIGGTITTTGGAPISGVEVRIHTRNAADANTGQVSYTPALGSGAAIATTNAQGVWKADVAFGKYIVAFEAGAYQDGYYNSGGSVSTNPATAPEVTVVKGAANANLSAQLAAATTTTIKGKVVVGTTPVQGVEISVEYATLNAGGTTTWTEVQGTKAVTNSNGDYTANVPPTSGGRTYVVGFHAAGYKTEYYNDKTSRTDATPVTATFDTPATGIDAALTAASTVSGKVTDVAGAGLAGVTVAAIKYVPAATASSRGTWVPVTSGTPATEVKTTTASDGTYQLEVQPNVAFRLRYTSSDTNREVRYFPAATVPDEGTNFSLTTSQALTGRNVVLPLLTTVAGNLTESTGSTFSGAGQVQAYRLVSYTELGEQGGPGHSAWFPVGNLDSVESGGFSLRLPTGTYRLKFTDGGAATTGEQGFLPGLVGLDQAPDIAVTAEKSQSNTYALPSKQLVQGKVTDAFGSAEPGRPVKAEYRYVTDIKDGNPVLSGFVTASSDGADTTDARGAYTLRLRGRSYLVSASSASNTSYYYPSAGTQAQAGAVTVNGNDVSGIDISLPSPDTTANAANVDKPWISGVVKGGNTLTANNGTWTPSQATFTYQWFQGQSAIANATAKTYVVPASGGIFGGTTTRGPYSVQVSATVAGQSTPTAVRSLPTGTGSSSTSAADPALENRATPIISGRAAVGETLTTDDGQWSKTATYTYQWLSGGAPIAGATTKTFVVTAAQIGRAITVVVNATDPAFPARAAISSTSANATSEVVAGSLSNTALPTISGDAYVGKTLTADPGTWSRTGLTYAYQWLSNGQAIPGANAKTYVVTADQVTKRITVRVTASSSGYSPASVVSAATNAVTDPLNDPSQVANKTSPVVTGSAKVGQVLTTTNGEWTNSPTSFSYQWFADQVAITGATSQSYTLTAAQLGKKITVEVTANAPGKTSGKATSDPTDAVVTGPIQSIGKPIVTGSLKPGQVLTATPGGWKPGTGLTFAYQWLSDGTAITGATSATYTVAAGDLGKSLAVRVTASAPGYDSATAVSDATAPVSSSAVSNSVKPSISGVAASGATLTLSEGTWDPAGTTFTYQWLADGAPVAGATGRTLVLTDAQVGAKISVVVTGSFTGSAPAKAVSAETETVTAPRAISVVGGPGVTGTAQVGELLTARPGTVNPSDASVSVQWLRDGVAIPGAVGTTYRLVDADLGTSVSARVTYAKAGYETLTNTSASVGPIVAAPPTKVTPKIKVTK